MGASTIDPTIPAQNSPLQSAAIRLNFQNAYNDITNLQKLWSGVIAPTSPVQFQLWENTGTTPPALEQYDGFQWVAIGTIDPVAHAWALAAGVTPPGSVSPGANNSFFGNNQFTGGTEFGAPTGGMPSSGTANFQAIEQNGVALSASAFLDMTNASNLASGTVPYTLLPLPTPTTGGVIMSASAPANQVVNYIGNDGATTLRIQTRLC